jgi:hypothetical protein
MFQKEFTFDNERSNMQFALSKIDKVLCFNIVGWEKNKDCEEGKFFFYPSGIH